MQSAASWTASCRHACAGREQPDSIETISRPPLGGGLAASAETMAQARSRPLPAWRHAGQSPRAHACRRRVPCPSISFQRTFCPHLYSCHRLHRPCLLPAAPRNPGAEEVSGEIGRAPGWAGTLHCRYVTERCPRCGKHFSVLKCHQQTRWMQKHPGHEGATSC